MRQIRRHSSLLLLIGMVGLVILACGSSDDGPPDNAALVEVTANSSLMPWLEEAAAQFNESDAKTSTNNPIYVQVNPVDAVEPIIDIAAGAQPDIWIPDSEVWADVLAEQGGSLIALIASALLKPFGDCHVATGRRVLGWPGRGSAGLT